MLKSLGKKGNEKIHGGEDLREYRLWGMDEVRYLQGNYKKFSIAEVANSLDRSYSGTHLKARSLGLTHPRGMGKLFNNNAKEVLAYILGVLKGDGTAGHAFKQRQYYIQLAATDKEFVCDFYDSLKAIGLNPKMYQLSRAKLSTKDIWSARAFSKPLVNWYLSMSPDDIYDFLKTDLQRQQFIRGFYESEGSLQPKSRQLKICNNDHQLIQLVERVLKDLGFNFHRATYGKQHLLMLFRKAEVERFLGLIKPVIPRRSLAAMGGWSRCD